MRECDAKLLIANGISRIARGGGANAAIFSAMKSSLKLMGVLDSDTVSRPLRPLTEDEKKELPAVLKKLDLLN